MSEYINNHTQHRKEIIKNVLRGLHAGGALADIKAEFAALAREASASEIAEIEQMLIDEGLPVSEIQRLCDVHVAVFREGLDDQRPVESIPGHPLHTFKAENQALLELLDDVQRAMDGLATDPAQAHPRLADGLNRLAQIDRHYLRKENLLFPFLEKYGFMGPSKVMWGIQDDLRADLRQLRELVAAGPEAAPDTLRRQWDELNRDLREMVYKEEKILFPTALDLLNESDWATIWAGEGDFGYFMVSRGSAWRPVSHDDIHADLPAQPQADPQTLLSDGHLPLSTGALTVEQINLMLTHLPIDVTFVDEDDRVCFYSQTRERIFDRTPAIIGRTVQNCHPPHSVSLVQQILDDFRAGVRDVAEFWINFGGRMVHIRYYALRDASGAYRGTIEVTQDIAPIRALQGEKRLLDD